MKILFSKRFNQYASLVHGFTTREWGDDTNLIDQELCLKGNLWVRLKQVHSNRCHIIRENNKESFKPFQLDGDALITSVTGVMLGIRTADCVPLLVWDSQKKVMGAIHAGWKGMIAGVIENTLQTMIQEFGSDIKDMQVVIGPCICEKCFEVGPEVAEIFRQKYSNESMIVSGLGDRYLIDLRKTARLILETMGVQTFQDVEVPEDFIGRRSAFPPTILCTQCNPDLFYSYRRGDREERMISFIGIKP